MTLLRETNRIYQIEKRGGELSRFAREALKVLVVDECENRYKTVGKKKIKMTNDEIIEKFKNKATGMIENLLEIMTIK